LLTNIAGVVAGGTVVDGSSLMNDPKPQAIDRLVSNTEYATCVLPASFRSDHWNESPTKKSTSSASTSSSSSVSLGVELQRSRTLTRTSVDNISLLGGVYEVSFSQPRDAAPVPSDVVFVVFEFLKDGSCVIHVPGHDHDIRVDNWEKQFDVSAAASPSESPSHARIAEPSALRTLHTPQRIRSLILFHVKQVLAAKKTSRETFTETEVGFETVVTAFEAERRVPPAAVSDSPGGPMAVTPERQRATEIDPENQFHERSKEIASAGDDKLSNLGEIFDAADEEAEGILRHGDLLNLLEATLCGERSTLRPWDIKTIMATIPDKGSGLIDYIKDCDGIPAQVRTVTKRREAYYQRFPNRIIPANEDELPDFLAFPKILEAVELLEGDEITETARGVVDACSGADRTSTGYVEREIFLAALEGNERVSSQEKLLLMQLIPEVVIEAGTPAPAEQNQKAPSKVMCQYETFRTSLAALRTEKVLHPLVETDIGSVRAEIVTAVRKRDLTVQCPAWVWRDLLMNLQGMVISVVQIHMILCLIPQDLKDGLIDVPTAVQVSVTLLNWYFDPELYHERAHMIQEQTEAEKKRRELEELQEMSGVRKSKAEGEGGEEEYIDLALRDNREEIEKNLLAIMQTLDEDKTGFLPAKLVLKQLISDWEQGIPGGGLTNAEKRGFMGECVCEDEEELVQYSKHIKTWIPILFELRKNPNCKRLLEVEDAFGAGLISLLDLSQWEKEYPIFSSIQAQRGSKGRGGAFGTKRRISADDTARRGSVDARAGFSKERRGSKVPRGSVLAAKNSALRASSKAQMPVVEPKELELAPGENRADRRRRIGTQKWAGEVGGNGKGQEAAAK